MPGPETRSSPLVLHSAEQQWELRGSELVIGRAEGCDVVLKHPTVSRRHTVLHVAEDEVRVEDLLSSTGTYVNGERVSSTVRLEPGNRLTVGEVDLTLSHRTPASRPPSPPARFAGKARVEERQAPAHVALVRSGRRQTAVRPGNFLLEQRDGTVLAVDASALEVLRSRVDVRKGCWRDLKDTSEGRLFEQSAFAPDERVALRVRRIPNGARVKVRARPTNSWMNVSAPRGYRAPPERARRIRAEAVAVGCRPLPRSRKRRSRQRTPSPAWALSRNPIAAVFTTDPRLYDEMVEVLRAMQTHGQTCSSRLEELFELWRNELRGLSILTDVRGSKPLYGAVRDCVRAGDYERAISLVRAERGVTLRPWAWYTLPLVLCLGVVLLSSMMPRHREPDENEDSSSWPPPARVGDFDPVEYLPKVEALAERHFGEVALSEIGIWYVTPDGQVDMDAQEPVTYVFAKLDDAGGWTGEFRQIDVSASGVRLREEEQHDQEIIGFFPAAPPHPVPSCTFRQIWEKLTRATSLEGFASASFLLEIEEHGGRRWAVDLTFEDGEWGDETLADDCEDEAAE